MSISVEEAVIARLSSHGKNFEILVDPYRALEVKKGKEVPVEDFAVIPEVFEDSAKGEKVSDEDLKGVFGTLDFRDISYRIIRKGNVQLTTKQRNKMQEEKKKKIVDIIARRSVNPQKNVPHTPKRIMNAMEEAKVKIDELKSAEAQVDGVVDAIKPIIPISMEKVQIKLRVPPTYTGKAYGKVSEFGNMKKNEWMNDGSWVAVVEIPAGLQGDFYNLLNSLTNGEAETKVVSKS